MTVLLKLNIRIILVVFVVNLMFLSMSTNYSFGDSGDILLSYPTKAGEYFVSGSIGKDEWRKEEETNAWKAKLWTFSVIHKVDGKTKGTYQLKGFLYNPNADEYVLDIKKERANQRYPAVMVYVFGFEEKPYNMTFIQNISVASEPVDQPITMADFKISGKTPEKLVFAKLGEKEPVIRLYFKGRGPNEAPPSGIELEPDEQEVQTDSAESSPALQSSDNSVSKPIEFTLVKRKDGIPAIEWCGRDYLVNSSRDYYNRVDAAKEATLASQNHIVTALNTARQRYIDELTTFGRYLRKMKLLRREKDQLDRLKAVCEEQIQGLEYSLNSFSSLFNELQFDQGDIILPTFSKHVTAYLQKRPGYSKGGEVFDLVLSAMKIEVRSQFKKLIVNELEAKKVSDKGTDEDNLDIDDLNLRVCVLTKYEAIVNFCKDTDTSAFKRYYVTAILNIGPSFTDSEKVVPVKHSEDSNVVFIDSPEEGETLPCKSKDEISGYGAAMNHLVKRFEDMEKIVADDKHQESMDLFRAYIKALRYQQGAVFIRRIAIEKAISQLKKNIDEIDQRLSELQEKQGRDEMSEIRLRIDKTKKAYINTLRSSTLSVVVPEVRGKNDDEISTVMMEEGRIAVDELLREMLGGMSKQRSAYLLDTLDFKPSRVQPLACREITNEFKVTARMDYKAESDLNRIAVSMDESLLQQLNLIEETKDPEGVVTMSDFIEGLHVRHYGFGLAGYTLKDAIKIIETGDPDWRLPMVEELRKLSSTVVWCILSKRTKIDYDVAYWTRQRAPSGDYYGFCFGGEGDCAGNRSRAVESPDSDALSLILIRND